MIVYGNISFQKLKCYRKYINIDHTIYVMTHWMSLYCNSKESLSGHNTEERRSNVINHEIKQGTNDFCQSRH